MGMPGRLAAVKIGTTIIKGINKWDMPRTAKEVDDTEFGDVWSKNDVASLEWKASFEGKVRADDAGQAALEEAFANGTLIDDIRFYLDTTKYYAPDVATEPLAGGRITSLEIGQSHVGLATIKISLTGSGPMKLFGT